MQTFKPLLLGAALAAGFVCAGAAAAAQPMDTINQAAPADPTSAVATQPIVSYVQKVYFFSFLDKNHNGELSRSEIPRDMHELRLHFVEADFDEDGQISAQEYLMHAEHTAPNYVGVSHAKVWVFASSGKPQVIHMP
ncbi:MAG TPA: EF-hand domain-containing protein [Rhodanobacteraceae bacterium]|jgi:hypothetical protein|nr:EF-hand domain-containing protein [Rhodanobacteraceae bacterium]